jgi:hypothetical protein
MIKTDIKIVLSEPIVLNFFSSETTITKFINQRLFDMVDSLYLDDLIIQSDMILPGILIKYRKFYV